MESPLTCFNVKLRRLRDYCGFNQSDLAEHLNITQPAYQKMECKSEPPRTRRIEQIAQFYGFTLTDFLALSVESLIQRVNRKKIPLRKA